MTTIKFRNAQFTCTEPTNMHINSVAISEVDYLLFWNSMGDYYNSIGNHVEWKVSYRTDVVPNFTEIQQVFPNNANGITVTVPPHMTVDFKIDMIVKDSNNIVLCSFSKTILNSEITP